MIKHTNLQTFLNDISQFDLKQILREDMSTYKDSDLPQQHYFINTKDKLIAHWVNSEGFILDVPLRFEKRYRKFKTLSTKAFVKDIQ